MYMVLLNNDNDIKRKQNLNIQIAILIFTCCFLVLKCPCLQYTANNYVLKIKM